MVTPAPHLTQAAIQRLGFSNYADDDEDDQDEDDGDNSHDISHGDDDDGEEAYDEENNFHPTHEARKVPNEKGQQL